jgi:cation transport regulator ChaC
MSETFDIFGYGSLLFSPELPEVICERQPARLPGYRRAFNKRSISRSCAREESFDAFPATSRGAFASDGYYRSLVLGTVADAQATIEGGLISYPLAAREQVIAAMDRREGYYPADLPASGYLRSEVEVALRDGQRRRAITYLTNQAARHGLLLPSETPLVERARILINATPRRSSSDDRRQESRGLYYLEGVREQLREIGIIDPELEALAAAIRAERGPWQTLVAPQRAIS